MKEFNADVLRKLGALSFAVARMRARDGSGGRVLDRRGGRLEFADHRPYTAGDDVRDLDWAAEARTGRLYVKEYERRDEPDVEIVLDASASMGFAARFETAAAIAWALAFVALLGGAGGGTSQSVKIWLSADGALRPSPRVRSRGGMRALWRFLSESNASGQTQFAASLAMLPAAPRGSRVLVVISDLLAADDVRRALGRASERGETVAVLHLVCASDWVPPQDAASVVDAETGERVAIDADSGDRAVRAAADAEREWRAFAARHCIRYVRADASVPAEDTVLGALRGGGVLR